MPVGIIAAVLAASVVGLPGYAGTAKARRSQQVIFLPGKATITAEVADTDELRQRGLMFRTHLGENEGMIFYFERTDYHAFYMYNTRIPLTVIFLNDGLRIVDMQEMIPCMERNPSACRVYAPAAACKYAIEVNPEFVRKYGIKTGNTAKLRK